jgi:cytochrome c553
MKHSTMACCAALLATLAVACGGGDGKSSGGATASATAASTGAPKPASKELSEVEIAKAYEMRCSSCHGKTGKGDGPGAAALTPKPRDYTDKAWQATVTDEEIKKAIIYGGAAVGKSPSMPAAPDLEQKPKLVDALVKKVRSFAQ